MQKIQIPLLCLYVIKLCFEDMVSAENIGTQLKVIPIVMATNKRYVRLTITAITSMLENANFGTFYRITVLIAGEVNTRDRAKFLSLEGKYKNCKIDFINMGQTVRGLGKRSNSHYYRIHIPNLLLDIKKCIYLDGDVIVRHDLSEMYDISMDNYYIAGVRDSLPGYRLSPRELIKAFRIPNLNQFVCDGVIIMNLEKLRKDKMVEKFINHRKVPMADQGIINSACYGKILPLPLKYGILINCITYNETYEDVEFARKYSTPLEWKQRDPLIVHFAGGPKPWDNYTFTKFHQEFWVYAEKTSLYRDSEIKYKTDTHLTFVFKKKG